MPNSNTSPQVTQGSRSVAESRETAHAFERLRHFADAVDYALRSYQSSLEQSEKTSGAVSGLWRDAAEAFGLAYQEMLPLEGLSDEESFPQAKDLLHHANHLADEAAGATDDLH